MEGTTSYDGTISVFICYHGDILVDKPLLRGINDWPPMGDNNVRFDVLTAVTKKNAVF
jgi:hypothetical protein